MPAVFLWFVVVKLAMTWPRNVPPNLSDRNTPSSQKYEGIVVM